MAEDKNIRELLKLEYKKCATDPMYFMKKYVKISHQKRGIIPFELFAFQEDTLNNLINHDKNIILKSRQMGISTLVSAYSLWILLFNAGKNVVVISRTQEASKEVVSKVRLAYTHLPAWLKVPLVEDNRLSLRLKNESRIMAASSASDSARGMAAYLLVLDECAFIPDVNALWTSAQQTLATGGRAILLSTPNGVGDFFHKMWMDAEAKKVDFKTTKLVWSLHPERTQTWRDKQTADLGVKEAAQECDTEFLSSGNTVVEMAIIEKYRANITDPIEIRGHDNSYWIWDRPDYSKNYIVSADVARGDGADYSAFQVIDPESLLQIAEYKGIIGTKDFGNMLVSVATEYNNALLVVENATYGWAVLQQIIDREYNNLYYSNKDLQYIDITQHMTNKLNAYDKQKVAGFTNSLKTRPLIIENFERLMREGGIGIRSKRLIDEISVFIWNNNKAIAMRGYNDDLVLSLCIGMWVRDTALRLKSESVDMNKALLNNIKKTSVQSTIGYSNIRHNDKASEAWKWAVQGAQGDLKENLNWLL